jgi:proline iminopeptidase
MDPEAYCAPLDLPGFELLVFAPRGTGESSPPPSPDGYQIAGYVADIESLRQHLGAERVTIYGSSHGGSVALAYATAHPDRVERLVLTNPPWRMDEAYWHAVTNAGHRFAAGSDDGATRLEQAQSAGALLRDPKSDLSEEQDHQYFRASLTIYVAQEGMTENDYLNRLSAAPRNRDPVAVMYAEFAEGLDLLAGVDVVRMPALVIGCEYDITVPVELTRLVAEALPNAHYVEFEGIGHLPEVEAPEKFNAAVTDFLSARE